MLIQDVLTSMFVVEYDLEYYLSFWGICLAAE